MYGDLKDFNPIPRDTRDFDAAMKSIRESNNNSIVKVVTDKLFARYVS